MRTYFLLLCLLFLAAPTLAQQSRIYDPCIRSLRAEKGGCLTLLPILEMGRGGETFEVSFDEMSHDYHRYTYRVQYCTYDWQPCDALFESEYLEATQSAVVIDDVTESRNTTTLYTHYAFTFPNREMRPLLSGNYRLLICDDDVEDPDAPVAEVCFALLEPRATIEGSVTTNTEVDWNAEHQQVEMALSWSGLDVRDARADFHTIVMQNHRLDNCVVAPRASYVNGDRLIWQHCRDLIFKAGNEYRKFETISTRHSGLHVEAVRWMAPDYHMLLATDEVRRNYLYYEAQGGTSVVRSVDGGDSATEAEYVQVHFSLYTGEPLPEGDAVYVTGQWAVPSPASDYRMDYDDATGCYTATLYLKQGYYDYVYLVRHASGAVLDAGPIEGNYYQTANEYTIYAYFRAPADRNDRLVAVGTLRSR